MRQAMTVGGDVVVLPVVGEVGVVYAWMRDMRGRAKSKQSKKQACPDTNTNAEISLLGATRQNPLAHSPCGGGVRRRLGRGCGRGISGRFPRRGGGDGGRLRHSLYEVDPIAFNFCNKCIRKCATRHVVLCECVCVWDREGLIAAQTDG